jgi:hypothetical protein
LVPFLWVECCADRGESHTIFAVTAKGKGQKAERKKGPKLKADTQKICDYLADHGEIVTAFKHASRRPGKSKIINKLNKPPNRIRAAELRSLTCLGEKCLKFI